MSLSILISDPDEYYYNLLKKTFSNEMYGVDVATNGRDAQLKCYKNKYHFIILDIRTENHSALAVLKYIKLTYPRINVILTISNKELLKTLDLTVEDLEKLGASHTLFKPYDAKTITNIVLGEYDIKINKLTEKNIDRNNNTNVFIEKEVSEKDDLFTQIPIDEFISGNRSIFDLHIRLSKDKYIKILNKGDSFITDRLNKYKEEKKVTHLYFLTNDRSTYIRYLNKLIDKMNALPSIPIDIKVTALKNVTEKFIEEIHTSGLKPNLVEEGQLICEHIHQIVKKETELYKIIRTLQEADYSIYHHSFLVAFLASLTCKHLNWESQTTIQKVAMAGMLHDIGKIKLDPSILHTPSNLLTTNQLDDYKKHPVMGVMLLEKYRKVITSEISDIILEHHETIDGKGFPNALSGHKIFHPAQIIGLVDYIANIMSEHKLNAKDSLTKFISVKDNVGKYDQEIIRAFFKCFIPN